MPDDWPLLLSPTRPGVCVVTDALVRVMGTPSVPVVVIVVRTVRITVEDSLLVVEGVDGSDEEDDGEADVELGVVWAEVEALELELPVEDEVEVLVDVVVVVGVVLGVVVG